MDVIGELLRASLLVDVGDDEERARRVRQAATRLGEELAHSSRPLVPHCVVAAIDETGSADSAVLHAADEAVLEEWGTFRNAFPSAPVELLRAVILAAVAAAAERDDAVRHAAWYAMRTALECLPVGRWRPVAQSLLAKWTAATALDIATVWTPASAAVEFRMPPIPSPAEGGITVNAKRLSEKATQLAGAGNYSNFATQLQAEIESFVDDLVAASGIAATAAEKRAYALLRDFSAPLGAKLRDSLAALERGHSASRLRTDLLWWRQTAYSERMSKPYAEMGTSAVAAAAAADLHDQVPALAPVAVEHLLADLVSAVTADAAPLDADSLADALEETSVVAGAPRATPAVLLDIAVGSAATSPLMPVGQSIPAARAAVILFRDMQARRLTPARAAEPEVPTEHQ